MARLAISVLLAAIALCAVANAFVLEENKELVKREQYLERLVNYLLERSEPEDPCQGALSIKKNSFYNFDYCYGRQCVFELKKERIRFYVVVEYYQNNDKLSIEIRDGNFNVGSFPQKDFSDFAVDDLPVESASFTLPLDEQLYKVVVRLVTGMNLEDDEGPEDISACIDLVPV